MTFTELDHPRARSGEFTTKQQSAPAVSLTDAAPLQLDRSALSPAVAQKLDDHLQDVDPATGRTYAETYEALSAIHVQQDIVFERRGAPPRLLWQLHDSHGQTTTVPPFVARAVSVPDLSEPGIAIKHRRDRASVAWQKAEDEFQRRRGRTDGATLNALRAKRDMKHEAYLELADEYAAVLDLDAAEPTAPSVEVTTPAGWLHGV